MRNKWVFPIKRIACTKVRLIENVISAFISAGNALINSVSLTVILHQKTNTISGSTLSDIWIRLVESGSYLHHNKWAWPGKCCNDVKLSVLFKNSSYLWKVRDFHSWKGNFSEYPLNIGLKNCPCKRQTPMEVLSVDIVNDVWLHDVYKMSRWAQVEAAAYL